MLGGSGREPGLPRGDLDSPHRRQCAGKCWTVPGQEPFATLDEAEQESRNLFEEINGVRFNGEPEFAHASA